MDATEVVERKKHLMKLIKDGSTQELMDCLNALSKLKATTAILTKTEIGLTVGKLKKHKDDNVSNKARALIKQWKKDIELESAAKKDTKSASKSESDQQKPAGKSASMESINSTSSDPTNPNNIYGIMLTEGNRTVKDDKISLDGVGLSDPLRKKSLELFYTALASSTNAEKDLVVDIARKLEEAVLKQFNNQSNDAYREKVRSLFLNLRDKSNPTLKLRVLSGMLEVEKFSTMSPEEMKSSERLQEEKRLREENLFKAQGAAPQESETDMFKCGKCKQRKCRYYQMQTRSADEPMTTFVTCVNCNNKWKFC